MIKKYKKLSGLLVNIEEKWDKLCQYDPKKKDVHWLQKTIQEISFPIGRLETLRRYIDTVSLHTDKIYDLYKLLEQAQHQ